MYKSSPGVTRGGLSVVVAFLLALAILITPVTAMRAAYSGKGALDSSSSNIYGLTVCDNAPVVTTNGDSGAGSLRQAITDACDGATITFDMNQVVSPITLATELVIDKSLTIQGPAVPLTIGGDSMSRIFNVNASMNFTFSSLTLSGGSAAQGGAVNNLGNLTILDSTLSGNSASGNGGAINSESGVVKIINSTISGNSAGSAAGGGLFNGGTSQARITNSTITLNNQGIWHTSSNPLLLNNTIVAGNPICSGCDQIDVYVDPAATIDPASSNNLIGVDTNVIGITNGVNGNQIGSGGAPVDPLLGALADNGGPTFTHALNDLSPAGDTGNNAFALDQNDAALTTDQRGTGFPRILNETVDIGAYEKVFVPPPPSANLGITKLAGSEESLTDRDIVYTITVTNGGPDAAANVSLNDVLPGDLTFVSLSIPAGWSCMTPAVGAGGTVTCTNPSLAAGSNSAFTLAVHIPGSTAETSYHNVATVSTTTNDPVSTNDQSSANTSVATCLTNPTVTSNADSGLGSLRQAIIEACDGSVITFNMATVVSPITLTSSELLIGKNLTITGPGANLLTISGNNTSRVFNIEVSKTVAISDLTIINGNGTSMGGAILNAGTLRIANSTISGSSVTGGVVSFGGAIYTDANLTLIDSTISNNSATGSGTKEGGGIFINGTGVASIINSTLSGNNAGLGGAISSDTNTTVTITNSTISGNSAGFFAGGVHASGTVNVRNSIISGNTSPSNPDVRNAFTSMGNNLIGASDGSTGFTNGVNNDKAGTAASPLNALLAPLGNYGGPTQTHALLPGSPAIDAGSNGAINDPPFAGPMFTDQRGEGFDRIANTTVDIGAFESRGFTITATSGTPQSASINTAFGAPLVATVSSAFEEPVSGGEITFTAPGAGASATFTGGVTTINATINATGQASASATANATVGGPYSVTAAGIGVTGTANFSLTNGKANQTINFAAIPDKTFGDADFVVSPTATSGLPVSLAATGNCTVTSPSPGTVHITGAGSCTITASQAGDATYNPAPNVPQSFTINKANQTITFGALANKTFGDPDFPVSATATSGLPVSFSATGNCTVTSPSPGTVHITGAGSCTITASQAGDANYNAAPDAPQNFTINKANQTISFGALANKTFGDPDFVVSASASTGLPVSFAASGNCTVTSPSPGTVHITGAGSCTITASQAGDANYNAAPNVPQSFTIAKTISKTAVTSSVNPSDLGQSVTFTATVSSGAGTPTGTVQFKDNGANLGAPVALNASGVAQLTTSSLTAGTHGITADYGGDASFLFSTGALAGGQVVRTQPSISINNVTIVEGNSGTQVLNFTATLSAASNLTVTATFNTANGIALAPSDYVNTNGTVTFNPGETSKTIPVTINGDVEFEADETFTVNLTSPVNATISQAAGTGTIQNDDALEGFIGFSQANTSVNESAGIVTVTVTRGVINFGKAQNSPNVLGAARVDYATDDAGASTNCAALNTGLASQRCDYTSVFGTLEFAANETQKTIDIPITLDAYNEGPEVFTVRLSNAIGGALAETGTTTVTINDSASPTPNAIDDTSSFVRQQYRDFLNREADAAGLAFWVNNIDKCNDPAQRPAGQTLAQCIEVQRITTSAAFFLSLEFKQTGGLVRDFYVAALDRPATNNMPNFVEFMRDTQAIQKGVTVGQGNWQQLLNANRTAFMNEFVTRAEFVGLYPATDTPTQYVDKLYLHANVAPGSPQERLDAIAEFGGAGTAADAGARGRALLRITQNAAFQARELNRAFVQMQYFGYLRRNPNDLPDGNFNGYNFWLNKLNQFNGNFLDAEMVKAFLSSLEYRSRFGP